MEEIELPYSNKEFKIEEIWIDLSKQSRKIKEIKIKEIQILTISNSFLMFIIVFKLSFYLSWLLFYVMIFSVLVFIYQINCYLSSIIVYHSFKNGDNEKKNEVGSNATTWK